MEELGNIARLMDIIEDNLPIKVVEEVYEIFIQASIIIVAKYKRMDKSILNRPEISNALKLAHYLQTNLSSFSVNQDNLDYFMGTEPSEGEAVEYYNKNVTGEVRDMHGTEVIIDATGLYFLYKSKDSDVPHKQASGEPDTYQMHRGKRLPWIRHVIQHTDCILVGRWQGKAYRIYAACIVTPYEGGMAEDHFFIVTRKGKGEPFRFVTAYHIRDYKEFLKQIERYKPYKPIGP